MTRAGPGHPWGLEDSLPRRVTGVHVQKSSSSCSRKIRALYTAYRVQVISQFKKETCGILKTYRKMMGQLRYTSKYPRWSEDY